MGIFGDIEVVCKSPKWDTNDLSGLSLTGLQPCFEDVVLLGTTYVACMVLCAYRISQCLAAKPYQHSTKFLFRAFVKGVVCVINVLSLIVLLSLIDDPADYELLVNPLGIVAWLFALSTVAVETRQFSYFGQWILRLWFLWIFVATAIRYPSQKALGKMSGMSYYFSIYLVQLVSTTVPVVMNYFERQISRDQFTSRATLWTASIISNGLQLTPEEETRSPLLQQVADSETGPTWSKESTPEQSANIFSRMIFSWMSPLMAYGYRHEIKEEHLWSLQKQFNTLDVSVVFDKKWEDEKRAASRSNRKPSLNKALFASFGLYFWMAAPLLAVQNVAQLTLPFLLGPLIDFMGNDQPVYVGYLYSAGFFIGLMIMTISENQYFDRVIKTGLKVRSSLVSAIFKHALRMSNSARQERSIGAIVNHMTSDTEKLQSECLTFHNLWSSPMRIVLGLYLLVSALGWSGVIGFVSVILLLPVQTWIMKKFAVLFGQVLGRSDARVRLLNEVLGGMRVIKYYAWEDSFGQKVKSIREDELTWLRKMNDYRATSLFMMNLNPVVLSLGTFVAFAFIEGNISASQAFQALALFQQLVFPLMLLPRSVSEVMQTMVSVRRIEDFLLSSVVDDKALGLDTTVNVSSSLLGPDVNDTGASTLIRSLTAKPEIMLRKATFQWDAASASPTLFNINLHVREGELVAVVGTTGSGKSSLISAILGEMVMMSGEGSLCGSVAYAPQQAWIFNATVKENILFGLEYNHARYEKAIAVSNLKKDIEHQFAAGDETEIGEKGINLSGGQRQRVNIARAVYADAEVYLFDDPLSALDAHVGAAVFHQCIHDFLRNKTRIFVTNQLYFMPQVDRIVVMKEGRIAEIGTFAELVHKSNGEFSRMYSDQASQGDEVKEESPIAEEVEAVSETKPKRRGSVKLKEADDDTNRGKLIVAEAHERGSVKWAVYAEYVNSIGMLPFYIMIFMYILSSGSGVASSMWLAIWSSQGSSDDAKPVSFYISIYVALSMSQVLANYFANFVGFRGAVSSSRVLHARMTSALLRCPMLFFDSTPLGRIINRFSKDMNQIDTIIMFNLSLLLSSWFSLLSTVVVIGINTTYVLVPFVPIMGAFAGVQNYYRTTSVQLKRIDSTTRSPVYAHFTEALAGMSTIRAYVAQKRIIAENARKLDENSRVYLLFMTSNRWLSIRLEFLGGLMILAAALNCVILRNSLSASAVGVAMAYALQITTQLNMLVRFSTEFENSFNSVERVLEYCALEPEAPRKLDPPPPNWPEKGALSFENLFMAYRKGLPPVLKGITLDIQPKQKVGVVGRTGAGKSSLFQSLFRIVEPSSGTVRFDGVDITTLGLDDVRKSVSIIPQEPVLFSGTLRFNLDPFSEYSDTQLWDALDKASLKSTILAKGEKLEMKVADNGENFSVGQRQLICLARALLKNSRILVLDEATANVDIETDALIQRTIRENFADRTTLTIAHRLNTIIDSDMVCVLELGEVKEFDTPANLLANPKSEFTAMVNETGPQNAAFLRKVAMGEVDALHATEELVAQARKKLETGFSIGDALHMGPLMQAIDSAALTIQLGFEERRFPHWEKELQEQQVSVETWIAHMVKQLHRLNGSAKRALEEENFDVDKWAQRDVNVSYNLDMLRANPSLSK